MYLSSRVLRYGLQALLVVLAIGVVFSTAEAQKTTPKKKKKKTSSSETIKVAPGVKFTPTRTAAPGSIGYYFFPNRLGASWTMRTIQTLYSDSAKIVRADTVYSHQTVVDTARFSLQRLPLTVCHDISYRSSSTDTLKTESYYYVDDSLAMTVFNNSVTQPQNKIFLVSPLEIGNRWHDQYDDTTVTMIIGFTDSVITPAGRFDSVLVTLTKREYSDLKKFFAPRTGIVKTVFRTVGPGGHGLVVITMEMIEIKRPYISDFINKD